jgi:hypothetical protein
VYFTGADTIRMGVMTRECWEEFDQRTHSEASGQPA